MSAMFKKLTLSGFGPNAELTCSQPNDDISVSGENALPGDTVGAMPAEQMSPPVPSSTPQGFGRLSVKEARLSRKSSGVSVHLAPVSQAQNC
jgi:hypothetical protein